MIKNRIKIHKGNSNLKSHEKTKSFKDARKTDILNLLLRSMFV